MPRKRKRLRTKGLYSSPRAPRRISFALWLKIISGVAALVTVIAAVAGAWQYLREKRHIEASVAAAPEYYLPGNKVADQQLTALVFCATVANTGTGDLFPDASLIVGMHSGSGFVIALTPDDGVATLKERQEKRFIARVDVATIRAYRASGFDDVTFVVRDGLGILCELHHCDKLLELGGKVVARGMDGKWVTTNVKLYP